MEWQDIATAPRDGAEFQAWLVREGYVGGFWEPRARFNAWGSLEIWGRTGYDEEGWEIYSHITATHWMPQPPPPVQKETQP